MRGLALSAALLVLGVPGSSRATLSEALSLRDLTRRADHVVLVTVTGEQARRDARDRIVTDFTLQVEDVMKGDAARGSTLVMTRIGGDMGDLGMRVEGEPNLTVGARYLMFLARLSGGATLRPVGMSQGVMRVEEQRGEPMVQPGGGGLSLVTRAGGRLVPAPPALLHPERYMSVRARLERAVAEDAVSDDGAVSR